MASSLGVSLALVAASTVLVSFEFVLSGIFMNFLFGEELSREYSLLSVGIAVTADRGHDIGLISLELAFIG